MTIIIRFKRREYMKLNVWYKTTLFAYKYLETVAQSIDNLVEQQALNSFYYTSTNSIDNSVQAVAERIINLSQRKVRLINIKLATEKALERCPRELAQLLIERYIDNERGEDIALRHNFSFRTYFRRLGKAEETFASLMTKKGYSEKRLCEDFSEDKWVNDIYQGFLTRKLRGEVLEDEYEEQLC